MWCVISLGPYFTLRANFFICIFAAMLILYTVAPLLYRMASSAYFNLSLLSSDFYGLLFGKSLYIASQFMVNWCFYRIIPLRE